MATKKSAGTKTTASKPAGKAAESEPAVKTAAKKVAVKKTAAKKSVDIQATAAEAQPEAAANTGAKVQPSHHDISVQAYLLWERDGKKHGHHDHHWKQAERELHEQ